MQDKVGTGVVGLDEILEGGIPIGHAVLLAGSSGTGKTILTQQFLFEGAKNGEHGVYISLSEPRDKIIKNLEDFKFFDKKLVEKGTVKIIDLSTDARIKGLDVADTAALIKLFRELVEESKAKRVVLDSITALGEAIGDEYKIREFIFELGTQLSYLDATIIFISEIPPQQFVYSVFGVEEFIADGVILLTEFERKGDLIRALQVIKMRGVDHSRNKYVLKITSSGVNLIPLFKAEMK